MSEKDHVAKLAKFLRAKKVGGGWRRLIGRRSNYFDLPLPGDDHVNLFRLEDGTLIWTSQPYEICTETAMRMVEAATKHGLTFYITGDSPYFPGRTVLIVWMKARAITHESARFDERATFYESTKRAERSHE